MAPPPPLPPLHLLFSFHHLLLLPLLHVIHFLLPLLFHQLLVTDLLLLHLQDSPPPNSYNLLHPFPNTHSFQQPRSKEAKRRQSCFLSAAPRPSTFSPCGPCTPGRKLAAASCREQRVPGFPPIGPELSLDRQVGAKKPGNFHFHCRRTPCVQAVNTSAVQSAPSMLGPSPNLIFTSITLLWKIVLKKN